MKKKIIIPLAIVFVLASVLIVTWGLYTTGALPDRVTYTINRVLSHFEKPADVTDEQTGSKDFLYVSDTPAVMPDDMHAVYVDLPADITTAAGDGAAYSAFIAETEDYLNYFKNFMTDTVFIAPDYLGKFGNFKDAYGNAVDVLREFMARCDQYGLFKVLVLTDVAVLADDSLTFDVAQYYLNNYDFNAVLLKSDALPGSARLAEAAAYFGERIRLQFGASVCFGVALPADKTQKYAADDTLAALGCADVRFAVIEGANMKNGELPFGAVMSYFNKLAAEHTDKKFYCLHRNDLVCSGAAGWGDHTEICSQVRYLWDCDRFHGSVFYKAAALRKNVSSSSLRLSYLYFDGEYEDLAISDVEVNDAEHTVHFKGKAATGHAVVMNGEAVGRGPMFDCTAPLKPGRNEFTFFSCGKSLTYRVYRNEKLIYSYTPQENMTLSSGDTVTIGAVCLAGAEVRCTVNGEVYRMTENAMVGTQDVPEGYCMYSCWIKFTGSSADDLDLGAFTISAAIDDDTETVTGGRIIVLQTEAAGFLDKLFASFSDPVDSTVAMDPETTHVGVSPYRDNGLGTARLCRIINDNTEQLGLLGEKDTYHADRSTLPEGTLDYVESTELSETGFLRYKLRSGMTVYGVNCELISGGYALPPNRVAVNHVDETDPACTNILFDMDWLGPINVRCKPQKYWRGYESYGYNISDFTAEYIEVKFYYAETFYNLAQLQFAENSVFSNAELYTEGDNNLILRLYLRRAGQFYGFDIYTNDVGQVVLSAKKHNGSMAGKVIMLDAGHGGLSMTGTALSDQTVSEKTVTLSIALKAKEMLENLGAKVVMTRTMDTPISLDDRGRMLCAENPDLFVSIHCDGTENEADSGTHSFYFRPYSQPLAKCINDALADVYKTKIYTPADANYERVQKSIKFFPFFVTRHNQCPSVLVETGFMTNPVEGQLMAQENTQYWLAQGIVNGISAYFAEN